MPSNRVSHVPPAFARRSLAATSDVVPPLLSSHHHRPQVRSGTAHPRRLRPGHAAVPRISSDRRSSISRTPSRCPASGANPYPTCTASAVSLCSLDRWRGLILDMPEPRHGFIEDPRAEVSCAEGADTRKGLRERPSPPGRRDGRLQRDWNCVRSALIQHAGSPQQLLEHAFPSHILHSHRPPVSLHYPSRTPGSFRWM